MPPNSGKTAEMTAVGTGVMVQLASSDLPRYMVAPGFDMSENLGMKRKVLIDSRGCGPGGASVANWDEPDKRGISDRPQLTYGRRRA